MEPGHEDREYGQVVSWDRSTQDASMEPGHEDREYLTREQWLAYTGEGLNGARS